jgi:hypothetical protein
LVNTYLSVHSAKFQNNAPNTIGGTLSLLVEGLFKFLLCHSEELGEDDVENERDEPAQAQPLIYAPHTNAGCAAKGLAVLTTIRHKELDSFISNQLSLRGKEKYRTIMFKQLSDYKKASDVEKARHMERIVLAERALEAGNSDPKVCFATFQKALRLINVSPDNENRVNQVLDWIKSIATAETPADVIATTEYFGAYHVATQAADMVKDANKAAMTSVVSPRNKSKAAVVVSEVDSESESESESDRVKAGFAANRARAAAAAVAASVAEAKTKEMLAERAKAAERVKAAERAKAAEARAAQVAAEAEKTRLAVAEAEKTRLAVAEAEKTRLAVAEAEKTRLAAAEAEVTRLAEAEAEVTRLAAAEAEVTRLAAAEAEMTRLAAEAEMTRLAAEAEETRLAAEAEMTRLAAEAEMTRLAAEAEITRLAAEAEVTRLAAEAEVTRLAAEAARVAAEEAVRARQKAKDDRKAASDDEEGDEAPRKKKVVEGDAVDMEVLHEEESVINECNIPFLLKGLMKVPGPMGNHYFVDPSVTLAETEATAALTAVLRLNAQGESVEDVAEDLLWQINVRIASTYNEKYAKAGVATPITATGAATEITTASDAVLAKFTALNNRFLALEIGCDKESIVEVQRAITNFKGEFLQEWSLFAKSGKFNSDTFNNLFNSDVVKEAEEALESIEKQHGIDDDADDFDL